METINLKLKESMVQTIQLLLLENLRNEKILFQKNNTIKSLENIKEYEKILTAIEVNIWHHRGE